MRRNHVPTIEDVNRLHALMQPHRTTYETQWAQIRNQHLAHTEVVDPHERWEMFQKTRIADFENSISFLNQLNNAIRDLYHNGRRPEIDPATHSVEALVAKNILELRESRNDEYIVAETRRCMTLLTQGLVNTAV